MKVLLVIHGYPPRYNAGSEVYTQTLAHGLKDATTEVSVFTREEDPFLPDYHLREEVDPLRPEIPVFLVNHARSNSRFRNIEIDRVFNSVLEKVQPDVVHFGHLNHLSTSLIEVAKKFGSKVVFTLHDFWLMCPRGQFLQWGLTESEPWKLCDGQENRKCAEKCFNRFVTGLDDENEGSGVAYWKQWIGERMSHVRNMCEKVDLFIAPSRRLRQRHIEEFGIREDRISYLDYGFDLDRLSNRDRTKEDPFVFGYIGRHHPSKGIDHLLQAFSNLIGNCKLRIWGRPEGQLTNAMKRMQEELAISAGSIDWLPEYQNENIVRDVFDHCDCIVVPSIWDENSPLVIHEAQQLGVPLITANHGGMGEYVQDGVNGLTFKHRDPNDLQRVMQKALNEPEIMKELGRRGYLFSSDGIIPSIEEHVIAIIDNYKKLRSENDEGSR